MQFQSDILGIPIERALITETTELVYLAGLAIGVQSDTNEISCHWKSSAKFEPKMSVDEREIM